MRQIGLIIIAAATMVEQLGLHCVKTTMAPRKVKNVLRCHVMYLSNEKVDSLL